MRRSSLEKRDRGRANGNYFSWKPIFKSIKKIIYLQFPFPESNWIWNFFPSNWVTIFGDDNIGELVPGNYIDELALISSNWLISANWRLHWRTCSANWRYCEYIGEYRGLPWSKIFDKYHFVIFLIYIAVIWY